MTMQAHLDFITNNFLLDYSSQELANAVLQLQRGLTGERKLVHSTYMETHLYLAAYLAYYWPVSYMQMEHCLTEISKQHKEILTETITDHKSISILDIGSGPGPMTVAILDFLARQTVLPESVACNVADTSVEALEKAHSIIKAASYPFSVAIYPKHVSTFAESTYASDSFDFIVFGHSLNEISEQSTDIVQQLSNVLNKSLAHTGLALLIEPSLLATSRKLIALRKSLIETTEFYCVSPCPNSHACSVLEAGESHTCHDSLIREIPELPAKLAKMLGLNRETIKMTWFAFSKHPHSLDQAIYRVVSDPMLNKAGRIRYIVCGPNGRTSLSAHKSDSHAAQIGFFILKRGDRFIIKCAEPRENGMGISNETEINLLKDNKFQDC